MWRVVTVFIVIILDCILYSESAGLNDYIQYFEELHYDSDGLHRDHQRMRRSLDPHLNLKFRAYKRDFHLKLRHDDSIYSPDHTTESHPGGQHSVDTSFLYSGTVVGVPRSYVHLAIINGTARGHVHIPGETTYHIEPAAQYFTNPSFHSVIYSEKHVNLDPYRERREAERETCGNDHNREWMKKVSESVFQMHYRAARSTHDMHEERPLYNKYSEPLNRRKRAPVKNLGQFNTCYLYLRSDPMLWKYIKNRKYQNTVISDDRAKEEILAFFASHVSALKAIYSQTVFQTYGDDLSYQGINFLVQRTKIMTTETEKCDTPAATAWCNPNIDVSNFLNLNSMDDHDDFCLAYVFTYRDFIQGTLGLAWVGSETKAAGGICEKYREYPEGKNKVKKSLNTGIVTIVNYGKPVQARVSQLTFAHEVGHNFGSPHDKGPNCAPYGTSQSDANKGNYIMFASATMGDKDHNDEFSSCSLDNITRVLHTVVERQNNKVNCFNSSKSAFCGNGIVEGNEECDCGYDSDCRDTDRCCWGKGAVGGTECTLKPGKQCSPTSGPCCDAACTFIPLSQDVLCKSSDDCSKDSRCNGGTAKCPDPVLEPNNTFCNSFSQVCTAGECIGSVCNRMKWEECFLTSSPDGKGPSREELCFVSCRNPNTNECVSSYNTVEIDKPANAKFKQLLQEVANAKANSSGVSGIKLPAGSPCDNFRGYCDVFHKCRGVDADGPLARLKNLIFNPQTLQTIKDWIEGHWWAVLGMCIALVIIMGVFIKVCAVHTPSSNPRKPAARKLGDTLRRRRHQGQGQGQGQGHKPQARSIPPPHHDPPPPYSSSASSSGPPPRGHGKNHHRQNNNKQGKNRAQSYQPDYEMQYRYNVHPYYDDAPR